MLRPLRLPVILMAVLAVASVPSVASPKRTASAAVRCALCDKPIQRGRETFLVFQDGTRETYRCVHCALTAQAASDRPSQIRTRSAT